MEAFGKYDLLKRIGAGGMGEVFLARTRESPDLVVVKRILPHLTENARFLRLFLDEARIAARLVHPNIARILELGEAEGSWFVAMEYVPGRDLRDLLRRMKEREELTPVEVALRIGVEVAAGLDYAHRATDNVGKPLKIVHRDVSPHNILISRYGDVKLIDFGVAKAANKSMHTATGILKGKFPYMAPEQANAKRVDPRTDVFALGIVLWELLTVRHLFRGKSDAATLKKVRACEVGAPSEAVPQIPKSVDKLLLRALEKEPRRRYPNARAFGEAIQEVLVGLGHADVQGFFHGLEEPNDFEDEASLSAADPQDLRRYLSMPPAGPRAGSRQSCQSDGGPLRPVAALAGFEAVPEPERPADDRPTDQTIDHPVLAEVDERREHEYWERQRDGLQPPRLDPR